MKYFCQFCAGAMLILSLTLSAEADTFVDDGHIPCPAVTVQLSSATVTGEVDCPGRQLAVSVIESVLSLF
jgi:hypothetical protein